jgi:hypothetical protein
MIVVLLAGLVGALGCASAGVETTKRLTSELDVVRPSTIVINDFDVSAKGVVVDATGPKFVTGPGEPDARYEFGEKVATALSEAIVAAMRERGLTAERGGRDMQPPMNALVLKGQFVTVDEGDQMARVTVGFGAGSTEVRARAQLYQQTETGLRPISEGELNADGNSMPGMLVPVAGGAIAGSILTSAAISGGLATLREIGGPLASNLEDIGEELADRTVAFYERRGWR